MGIKEKLADKVAEGVAKHIDKGFFLQEMAKEWKPHLKPGFDVEEETNRALGRIKTSGQGKLFQIVGVTKEDIRNVLEALKSA